MSSKKIRLDLLGDRMKTYEKLETSAKFIPGLPVYVRIDGRGFSKFTKQMTRPYDQRLSSLMLATTEYLVKEFNATVGYVQSDEISLVIKNEYESPATFEGKKQKLVSTLAASATAFFNANFEFYFEGKTVSDFSSRLPTFDCRIFNLPNWDEVANSILWRYLDALKNSKQMLAHHYFSHKELQNLNGKQLIDKLKLDKNVIWEDYPEFFRAGVLVQRIRTEVQTENGPVTRHKVAPVRLPLPFHCLVHAARVRIVSNDFNEEENV